MRRDASTLGASSRVMVVSTKVLPVEYSIVSHTTQMTGECRAQRIPMAWTVDSGRWTLTEVGSALTGVLVAVQVGELLGGHAGALRLAVPRRRRRRRQGLPLHAVTLDALFSTCFNIIICCHNTYCRIRPTITCSCWGCCYRWPSAAH